MPLPCWRKPLGREPWGHGRERSPLLKYVGTGLDFRDVGTVPMMLWRNFAFGTGAEGATSEAIGSAAVVGSLAIGVRGTLPHLAVAVVPMASRVATPCCVVY